MNVYCLESSCKWKTSANHSVAISINAWTLNRPNHQNSSFLPNIVTWATTNQNKSPQSMTVNGPKPMSVALTPGAIQSLCALASLKNLFFQYELNCRRHLEILHLTNVCHKTMCWTCKARFLQGNLPCCKKSFVIINAYLLCRVKKEYTPPQVPCTSLNLYKLRCQWRSE